MPFILISRDIVVGLAREAYRVFHAGAGYAPDENPGDDEWGNALVDYINPEQDPDLLRWAHMILHFARMAYIRLNDALNNEENVINLIESLRVEDE